jgi:hypothetical protein
LPPLLIVVLMAVPPAWKSPPSPSLPPLLMVAPIATPPLEIERRPPLLIVVPSAVPPEPMN